VPSAHQVRIKVLYYRGQDPIGRHLGFGSDPGTRTDMEIIGVVKDIKYTNLRDDIPEQAFIPYLGSHWLSSMTVYLRTKADPNQLIRLCTRRSVSSILTCRSTPCGRWTCS